MNETRMELAKRQRNIIVSELRYMVRIYEDQPYIQRWLAIAADWIERDGTVNGNQSP